MAKKSAVVRNLKRKCLVVKFAERRAQLKASLASPQSTDEAFFAAQRMLAELPRNSSAVRVRNRCSITGRSRGFHRYFGISRLMLRELVAQGLLPGVTKSSW